MENDLTRIAAGTGFVACMIVMTLAGGTAPLERATAAALHNSQSAAAFFVESITIAQIRDDYRAGGATSATAEKKVRILIVPGHQPDSGGTEFNGVHERDVVVDIANALADLLAHNPHYDVIIARGQTSWNPVLASYFDTHASDIDTFILKQKQQMVDHVANGSVATSSAQISHLVTPLVAARQLYGINKWAGENHVDITLHLHLNDYAGRRPGRVGKYDGFAVYVPDHQYSNAKASKAIGEAIAARLNSFHATSTILKEDVGVVEDQDLIAIGSNNTADNAALLIEYGYIYEPQFQKPSVRATAVADYAYETYLGLQDFFKDPIATESDSSSLSYDLASVTARAGSSGPGVYALQSALRKLNFYPPSGKSFSDCPVSGKAGPCTVTALTAYQKARGLEATGTLGPKTRAALEKDLASP